MTTTTRATERAGGTGVLAICYAAYAYFWGSWVVVFGGWLDSHGLTPGQGSTRLMVLSITAIGAMTVLAPRLASASARATIAAGLTIQGLGAVLIAQSSTGWLFAAFAFTGVGTGLVDVFVNAAGQALEVRTSRPVLQTVHALYGVGGAVAALCSGGALAAGASIETVLWSAALVQLLAAAMCSRSALAPHGARRGAPAAAFALAALTRWPLLLVPAFIVLAAFFIEGSMDVWSVIYLRRTLDASTLGGSAGFAAFALATTVGRLFAARVLFSMGYRRTILLSGLGSAAAGLLAATAQDAAVASAGFLLLGLCVSAAAPAAFGLAGESGDAALAIAAMTTVGYTGFVLGPPALGWLAERGGLRATMGALMAATVVILVCGVLGRRGPGASDPSPRRLPPRPARRPVSSPAGGRRAMGANRSGSADVLITGAAIYTADACRRWADALAIADGRIAAVGTEEAVRAHAGAATRVLELDGCMVVPGFQDAHVHPLHGGLAQLQCDLHEVGGRAAYAAVIAAYARSHPESEWIVGSGWAMDAYPGGTPHRSELDRLVGDRPAYLVNRDGHGAWVNSRALELAGVTAQTPDPRDGRIERDPDGAPSGTLHEGAMSLVSEIVPAPSSEDLVEGLRRAQRHLHALGITAWNDASVEAPQLDAYLSLAASGQLTARVVLSLLWDRARGEEQIPELLDRRVRGTVGRMKASNVKIFQDGVAENFTAAMLEPYLDASGSSTTNRGLSMVPPDELRRVVTALDRAGFQIHVHAIGDRAVREALDAFDAARAANGVRDARHHIAHIQVIHPEDIPRFRSLGVVANAQPYWAYEDAQMRDLTIPFLGSERARLQYPFGSLRRAGATIAFGSDWPVSTPDPLLEMDVAVTRTSPEAPGVPPFLPEQSLDLPAALDAFTVGSAFVNHLESDTGSLEVGKLADLAVLDRDLFATHGGRIGDAGVLLTLVQGEMVHARESIWE